MLEDSCITFVCLNRFLRRRAFAMSLRVIGGLLMSSNSFCMLYILAVHVDLPPIMVVQGLYEDS